MNVSLLEEMIERVRSSREPRVEIIKRIERRGNRIGVFASSFNPPTIAHVELIRGAAEAFALDETIALASVVNADKLEYEASLEDRLAMLALAFEHDPRVSTGLSSHAFYVDMLEALTRISPAAADLHFIVGFDTFERVLDHEDRYTKRYYRQFSDRVEAIESLFARCSFIVADRAGAGLNGVKVLVDNEPAVRRDRVLYLDFPAELAERSATQVRDRRRAGESIAGLVPAAVERFIQEQKIYQR